MTVAIIDLGYGNIGSILRAFARLGAQTERTADAKRILAADRVVLPGVGAAGFAMGRIHALGLADTIRNLTQPVIGICLGMQLLFDHSEEGDTPCLGIIAGLVRKLEPARDRPVPHMGWSRLSVPNPAADLSDGDYAYFAHSYVCDGGPHTIASVEYGAAIPAVVARDNFTGVQFHPERSSETGARLLAGFLA